MIGVTSRVFGRPARFITPCFLAAMLILHCYLPRIVHNSAIANEPKVGDVTTKLTLSGVGDVFEIDTGLLIEGVAKELSIDAVNQSGFYFKDLSHRVSCACLRLKNTDGKDMREGEKLNLMFSLLPTHGGYGQSCVINGIGEDGTRTPICKLVFTGKVIAPVALSQTAVTVSDLANDFSCSLAVQKWNPS